MLALALGLIGASSVLASGSEPTAETERAEEITRTAAVLHATVNPHGATTSCVFEYGTNPSVKETASCAFAPGSRPIDVPEYADLTGLTPGQTYFFRIHATNENGSATGEEHEFTALPAKPRANTELPTEIKRISATLRGFVTPNAAAIENCYFSYGTEPGELNKTEVPCKQTVGAGGEPSAPVEVTTNVTGLTESQVYYYRLFARNENGTDKGGQVHFTTLPSAPKANTEPAGVIGLTEATLRGFVTPNDALLVSCFFEYGKAPATPPFEKTVACETLPGGMGETPEAVSAHLTGLAQSTTYQFRLVATNSHGEGDGGVASFTTQPRGPKVLLHQARNITAHTAELAASVDPELSKITECYFEYGTTPAMGGIQPCTTLPGEGETYEKVGATVSGLNPSTAYLVRIVVVNAHGEARGGEGEKKNFTTASGGEAPVVTGVKPNKGKSSGGTHVKIKGEHFEAPVTVDFGDAEATVVKVEVGKLEVISPPGVGIVDVTVSTEAGTSKITSADHFTYGKPEIAKLDPNTGPKGGGTAVTVTGSGFELGAHGTIFVFGGATATSVECTSSTECIVIAPPSHRGITGEVDVRASVNAKKSPKLRPNDVYSYTP